MQVPSQIVDAAVFGLAKERSSSSLISKHEVSAIRYSFRSPVLFRLKAKNSWKPWKARANRRSKGSAECAGKCGKPESDGLVWGCSLGFTEGEGFKATEAGELPAKDEVSASNSLVLWYGRWLRVVPWFRTRSKKVRSCSWRILLKLLGLKMS